MKMVCLQWRPVLSPVLCSVSLINLHLFILYSHGLLSFAPLPGIQHFVCGLVYILQETRAPVSPETNPNQTRRSYQCYEFGSFSCYSSIKKLTAHKNVFLLLQRYITKAATRSSLACGSAPMDVLWTIYRHVPWSFQHVSTGQARIQGGGGGLLPTQRPWYVQPCLRD